MRVAPIPPSLIVWLGSMFTLAGNPSAAAPQQPAATAPASAPKQASAGLPVFSPDGRHVAFSHRPPGQPAQLHVIEVDGANERALTSGTASVFDIAYDASGKRLLFRSGTPRPRDAAPTAEQGKFRYSCIDVDGANERVVAEDELLGGAAWSPDGRRVAMSARVGRGPTAVMSAFVADADGTNRRELVTGLPSMQVPAWSPDGRLTFAAPSDKGFVIVVAGRDGTDRRPVVAAGPAYQSDPEWSRDGKKLLFKGADQRPERGADGSRLYIVNADGSGLQQLLADAAELQHPKFSEDGGEILFVTVRDGNTDIFLMKADGSDLRRLTTDAAYDEWPSFSPDERSILFQRSSGAGDSHIFLMARDGSNVRQLR